MTEWGNTMVIRFFWAAVLLALSGLPIPPTGRAAEDCEAEKDRHGGSGLVQRTYPVADLILSDHGNCSVLGAPIPTPAAERTPDELIELIVNTIAAQTWSMQGGPGTIEYVPLGMAFLVNQTPEVHERIAELLEGLRRIHNLEVQVEFRMMALSEPVFQRVCKEYGLAVGEEIPPGVPQVTGLGVEPKRKVGRTVLTDMDVFRLMEFLQEQGSGNVLQAPKLTAFNKQTATVQVQDFQWFVTKVQIINCGGKVVVVPEQESVAVGLQVSVKPVASVDRKAVRLDLSASLTDAVPGSKPLKPTRTVLSTSVEADGSAGLHIEATEYPPPIVTRLTLNESVSLTDGGTVVFAGWQRMREAESWLGQLVRKVPFLGDHFQELGNWQGREHILLLATPKIVEQARKELVATPTTAQTALEKKLRAAGFEDDPSSYMLVRRFMVLKDLCNLLNCQTCDFKPPRQPGYPGLPPMDFHAPNSWLKQGPGYFCSIWFLDPAHFPKDLGEAEVQVGFLLYGEPDAAPCPPGIGEGPKPLPGQDAYEIALITAIHHFAEAGEAELLHALLNKHPEFADIDRKFLGGPGKPMLNSLYRPLHRAAERGHSAAVRVLLEKGADPNGDGGSGCTPLHVAARMGHLEVVKLLVRKGANFRALTKPQPGGIPPSAAPAIPGAPPRPPVTFPAIPARSPLDVAREANQTAVVEYLTLKLQEAASPQ